MPLTVTHYVCFFVDMHDEKVYVFSPDFSFAWFFEEQY